MDNYDNLNWKPGYYLTKNKLCSMHQIYWKEVEFVRAVILSTLKAHEHDSVLGCDEDKYIYYLLSHYIKFTNVLYKNVYKI